MQCQMYHLVPFAQELRTAFVMPSNPYFEGEAEDKAIEYLRELNVVFYRDEENAEGILIMPTEENMKGLLSRVEIGTPIDEWPAFVAYHSACDLNFNAAEGYDQDFVDAGVVEWDKPSKEIIVKWGDAKAWVRWNEQIAVARMTSRSVIFG